jgi:hypothetical protein
LICRNLGGLRMKENDRNMDDIKCTIKFQKYCCSVNSTSGKSQWHRWRTSRWVENQVIEIFLSDDKMVKHFGLEFE